MRLLTVLVLATVLLLFGCNTAKDTAQTTEQGGQGAVGIAEKMSGGTVGDTDVDTGESPEEGADDSDTAEGSGGE